MDNKKIEEGKQEFIEKLKKFKQTKDDIENDPRLSAMEKNEANARAAYSFHRKTVAVTKLSILENIIVTDPDFKYKPMIAMYIYFKKSDKVNKIFYPNLYRIMEEFEDSVAKAQANDPYFEVFKIYELTRNKKKVHEFYMEARYYLLKLIKEENLSINQVSEYTGIKYSNLYNFLVKSQDNKVKLEKLHKALWMVWGLKEGWTKERAILEHKEKMKTLWLHWRVDIDGMERDDE